MEGGVPITVTGSTDHGMAGIARVCLARGHTGVAAGDAGTDGRFKLVARSMPGPHLLLVIADGREAVRRHLMVEPSGLTLDVGRVVLVPVEWPAGVHGHLWDEDAQSPVHGGLVALSTDQHAVIGSARAAPDGAFTIRMTCQRPLPPGDYHLDITAPGYGAEARRVPIALEPSVTELGRVHLAPLPRSG
jgi:hypothetical protein